MDSTVVMDGGSVNQLNQLTFDAIKTEDETVCSSQLEMEEEEDDFTMKRICIQDSDGKVYFIQIGDGQTAQLFGLDEDPDLEAEPVTKRRKKWTPTTEMKPEAKESLDGYDPVTGEVLGPVGDPVGPGNGSVVVREISATQDINQAWFTTKEDKDALVDKGINWKQGTWAADEVNILNDNILHYCKTRGIEDPAEVIFDMSKDERKDFYRSVSHGLQRPLFAVYRRVIRMYDAKNHIGKYTEEELDKLKVLRQKHGTDWAVIGAQLGRSAASVKDRCRLLKETCNTGKWFPEEEKRLVEAVHEVSGTILGTSVTSNLPWAQIATVVKTRSEKQCRTKWLNYLNWKQAGGESEWTRADEIDLVTKISRCGAVEESAIDWETLAQGWPSVRSPQWLRSKWWCLKRTIAHYQSLSLSEIVKMLLNSQLSAAMANRASSKTALKGSVRVGSSSRLSLSGHDDFWGVGEDSNGAASTSSITNGIGRDLVQHEGIPNAVITSGLDGTNVTLKLPPLSIAPDLAPNLMTSSEAPAPHATPTLHIPPGIVASVADSIAGLSSYVRGVMTMPQLQQRETDECREGITSPPLGGPTPPDLVIGRDAISPTLHPGVTQMDEVANDHQTFMITSEGQIIPCEGQLVPYSSSHSDGDGLLSHRILLRNIEGQQIVIKDDGGTEGLLSDAALVAEEDGHHVTVECIEDEDLIHVGVPSVHDAPDVSDVTGSGFIVIDAPLAGPEEDLDDKTDELESLHPEDTLVLTLNGGREVTSDHCL